jgi:hypothetical protein
MIQTSITDGIVGPIQITRGREAFDPIKQAITFVMDPDGPEVQIDFGPAPRPSAILDRAFAREFAQALLMFVSDAREPDVRPHCGAIPTVTTNANGVVVFDWERV